MSEREVTQLSPDETRLLYRLAICVEVVGIISILWNTGLAWTLTWQHGEFRAQGLWNIGSLLVAWPMVRHSRRLLVERGLEPFLIWLSAAFWLVAISFVLGAPEAFPVTAFTAMLPVMMGAVASQALFKRLLFGS